MRRCVTICIGLAAAAAAVRGHDMFLVVPDHSLPAHSQVTVALYNGTFAESENTIDRDRMVDVSVVDGRGSVSNPAPEQWREEGSATLLDFETGEPGTYVVGVSTAPRVIELSAEEFDDYLEHDGVLDVLAGRRAGGVSEESVAERYSKHVKTILEVGGAATDSWSHRLGYPIEIVPLASPAELEPGDTLEVLVLFRGEPVTDQLVYASHAGFDAGGEDGAHREAQQTRTDGSGVATIQISTAGRWYVRLIHMTLANEEGLDYESNWATLTFEVK